jgi:hypothetical protein
VVARGLLWFLLSQIITSQVLTSILERMDHLAQNNHCAHKEFLLTADKQTTFQKPFHSYGLVRATSIRSASDYCETNAAELTTK